MAGATARPLFTSHARHATLTNNATAPYLENPHHDILTDPFKTHHAVV